MRSLYILIFISIQLLSLAQGFRVRHRLPGAQNNTAKAIFEISPGNYITGGIIVDSVNGVYSNRLCLMGLDNQGQIQWVKKYGDYTFEYLDNIFTARSFYKQGNNIYYTGCVRDSNNKQIGVLIKFNFLGDSIWKKVYRDTAEDVIPQMVTASVDGGFLLTGFFQNWALNTNPCLLIKTDINGSELWRKKINKALPNVHDGKGIVQDSASKRIAIIGYQYTGTSSSWSMDDNVLILDSLGNTISQHNYTPGFGGWSMDLIQTRDKKLVVVGRTIYPQTVGGDNLVKAFISKFDINNPAIPIWTKMSFGQLSLTNFFHCVVELDNEDLLIGGIVDTIQLLNNPTNCLIRITKMDKNGAVKSNRYHDYNLTPGNFNFLNIKSLNLTSDGGYVAAIAVNNSPAPNPFFFVKYDSLGCDTAAAYCQMIAAGIGKNYVGNSDISIYPNPGNGLFYFSTKDFQDSELQFTVSDLSGRIVKELWLSPQQEKQLIDLEKLSNGVYLVTLTRDNELIYKTKLIKQD